VFGQGGNDTVTLNEANCALPAVQLFGGGGNDTLTGGSGNVWGALTRFGGAKCRFLRRVSLPPS
jgi:Ca2+-binding RTX toxin-like protein